MSERAQTHNMVIQLTAIELAQVHALAGDIRAYLCRRSPMDPRELPHAIR